MRKLGQVSMVVIVSLVVLLCLWLAFKKPVGPRNEWGDVKYVMGLIGMYTIETGSLPLEQEWAGVKGTVEVSAERRGIEGYREWLKEGY